MSRKKNKKTVAPDTTPNQDGKAATNQKRANIVAQWNEYIQKGDLEDWQRLCHDLGLIGDFGSKTKCRKALDSVWVNIHDFLHSADKTKVHKFPDERSLAAYTIKTGKIYPKKKVPKGSPLRKLLAHVFN